VPLVAIGQFSFSLYLVHAPLLAAVWVFFVKPVGLASGAGLALMVFVVMPATVAATGSIGRSSDRS
jgi:peptidoglycan/LPS O-acetylase OafA/YrhL